MNYQVRSMNTCGSPALTHAMSMEAALQYVRVLREAGKQDVTMIRLDANSDMSLDQFEEFDA